MNNQPMLAAFGIAFLTVLICGPTLTNAQAVSPRTGNNAAIENLRRSYEVKITSLSQLKAETQARLAELSSERLKTSERLFELNVTDASYNDVMRLLQTERVQLMIDLAGLDARQKKLVEIQSVEEQPQQDEVIELLAEMVDSISTKVEVLQQQFAQGAISTETLRDGQLTLLQAKLKLAEAKTNAPRPVQNEVLTDVAIERVEKQAKLATVESLLKKYYGARTSIDSLHELETAYEMELGRKLDIENLLRETQMDFQMRMNDNN